MSLPSNSANILPNLNQPDAFRAARASRRVLHTLKLMLKRHMHDEKKRPDVLRLALWSKPVQCPSCGAHVEIWRPLRFLALVFSIIAGVFAAASNIQVRSAWPFAAALLIAFLLQLSLAKWGPLVMVSDRDYRYRKIAGIILLIFLVGMIALDLLWKP